MVQGHEMRFRVIERHLMPFDAVQCKTMRFNVLKGGSMRLRVIHHHLMRFNVMQCDSMSLKAVQCG